MVGVEPKGGGLHGRIRRGSIHLQSLPPPSLLQNVLYWYRYVDDVLCAWSGSINQLHEFLGLLNSRYPSIRFTMEIGGRHINFLDLGISINEHGQHEFEIYRKPTHTDVVISGNSFDPPLLTNLPLFRP